jgi:beta-lactamase class A
MIAVGDDGSVNFLHSARPAVREQPLVEYVNRDRRCLGIKILRLRPDAERIMASALASSPDATEVNEESLRAALAATPVMSTGAPPTYTKDWAHAMQLQSYRLPHDAPLDPELQSALQAIDRSVGEELGIPPADRAFGVLDLTDLRLAVIQPDAMFYAASVPKICIVMAYFETHPEAASHLDPDVERELQLVIKRSDNELAAKYSQLVGLEKIQEILQSRRYRFYDEDHGGFWCGKHYGIAEPRMGDPVHDHSHAATVRQCLRYYLMLEQGRLVSAAACAKLKEIFAAPLLEFHDDRFVRGLNGRDVTIIRKSGLWEDWHLDTARIQHGERVYLLAGMVHHPKGGEYLADMAAAVDETLCGPLPRKPFSHRLIMHTSADDFEPGTFANARLADDGTGIVLDCPVDGEASYESPVIEPEIKFNEAVISWNVDMPPDSGVCVEIRVGRRFDAFWSPYLNLEYCGNASLQDEHITMFDGGRIDVDYFRSDQRFDRIQYRIRAAGDGEKPANLCVRRIAVCVNDLTGIPPALMRDAAALRAAPPAEAWQRRLPVPFRSQATDNPQMVGKLCSPTSVAMMLEYRGVDVPNEEVATACYDPVHEIYGNWPRAIQAAYSFGVPGYLACFSDWDQIKRMIAADQPLVMSIRTQKEGDLTGAYYDATVGHLLVLVGFEDDDHIAVNDPAYRDPDEGQRTYLREDLENVWMRARGGLAYVLLPRD